jgi:hypothetical protein
VSSFRKPSRSAVDVQDIGLSEASAGEQDQDVLEGAQGAWERRANRPERVIQHLLSNSVLMFLLL